jgi:hypothetical protein
MNDTIEINGNYYALHPQCENPTMYIWAAAHVVGPDGIQWDDFESQTKFIEKMRFPAVLHEFFKDVIYDPKTRLFTKRDTGEPAVEFQRILEKSPDILLEKNAVKELADLLGHKVIGCDSRAHLHPSQASDEERETEQADVIERYNGTVQQPHLAIIGAIHCLPSHYLNRLLQEKRIDYTIVHKLEMA